MNKFLKAFTLIELIIIITIVVILAAFSISRIGLMKRNAALSRNQENVLVLADALNRFQINGGSLTNISSLDNVTQQLIQSGVLFSNIAITPQQITMYWVANPQTVSGDFSSGGVEGTLYFHPTYNP